MSLVILVSVAAMGALVSGLAMGRDRRIARAGASAGVMALLVVTSLVFALDPAESSAASLAAPGHIFDGMLAASGFLRLVIGLWALSSIITVCAAALLHGLAGLRTLLPATLAALAAGSISLGATNLGLAVAAAAACGLAALLVLTAAEGPAVVMAAAREVRMVLLGGAVLGGILALLPVSARLVELGLGDGAATDATGLTGPAIGPAAGPVVGLLLLAGGMVVAMRFGMPPFHLRISRITDLVPPITLPLVLAWIPVPLAAVGMAIVDTLVAPLALPLDGERMLIIGFAIATMAGAALAAYAQDDIRHGVGYLVIADAGVLAVAVAALDPVAWGPARTWIVTMAATKSALAAWAAVTEDRFDTRSMPDLRGWMRKAPILAAGLVLTALATFGLPGWAAFTARSEIGAALGTGPLPVLMIGAGLLSLPVYLRLIIIGVRRPTSRVDGAAPERLPRAPRWARQELLSVEADDSRQENPLARPGSPSGESGVATEVAALRSMGGAAGAARAAALRAATAARLLAHRARVSGARAAALLERIRVVVQRDRAELLSVAVVALAVLALLTSWGALDISRTATEPAPIVSAASGD